jgi:Beta-lactamase enzyme family
VDPRTSLGAPAGLSIFQGEADVSVRDLAASMITVSDALATDLLLERVGMQRVNDLMRSLGFPSTVVVDGVRSMFESLARDVGFATLGATLSTHPCAHDLYQRQFDIDDAIGRAAALAVDALARAD